MRQGTAEEIALQKRALRAAIRSSRASRAALAADDPKRHAEGRALARAVLEGAAALVERAADDGTPVCSYESLPGEPPTRELHEELAARGITVLVPFLLPDKDLDWVRWLPGSFEASPDAPHRASPDAPQSESPDAPQSESPCAPRREALGVDAIARARLIVVPALAVDAAGRRLGQGGGSYDRALTRRHPYSRTVALIDGEPAARLPALPHDQPVDAVVSASRGWRDVGPRGAPDGAGR